MTESDLRSIVSRNIKKYRALRQLSQEELSEEVDISVNFLSNIESGRRWISPLTMVKFAAALKIEPYELFKPEKEGIALNPAAVIDEAITEVTQTLNKIRSRYL
jgi:transcriptional regulator with XRE-family HTH domain